MVDQSLQAYSYFLLLIFVQEYASLPYHND